MSVISLTDELMGRAGSCSIFERALDALPDGVLLVAADRSVVYMNPAFRTIWRIPEHVLAARDDRRNLSFVMDLLADPQGFRDQVEHLHGTSQMSQDEVLLKDGRTLSRRSLPFQNGGDARARIWIFTDITEAKRATVDHLTQLGNRLAFSREFPPFVTAPWDGLMRAVAMVDVDHFKRYNDLYGHAEGDRVLSRIGQILKSHLHHAGDLAFRIGGEEFLLAMRTRKTGEAAALCENIRAAIEAASSRQDGKGPHRPVTVSIGFGSFEHAPEPGRVFQRVDQALYEAKALGRNRVVEVPI